MAKKNLVFNFPESYRQLKSLEYDLQEAEAGATREAAFKAFCDASHAFEQALKTLPKPRRCKHKEHTDDACKKCGIKFVPCNGEAHTNPIGYDHCMVCLPWGWGFVPEHQPNRDINEMKAAVGR